MSVSSSLQSKAFALTINSDLLAPASYFRNKMIADSNFTVAWLEQTLQRALKINRKFGATISVERIGAGQGFLSTLLQIFFDWQTYNGETVDLPRSVVLKIPSMKAMEATLKKLFAKNKHSGTDNGIDIQSIIVAFQRALHVAHAAEVAFYQFCACNQIHMPKIAVPVCFFAQKFDHCGNGGILVLEDLRVVAAVKPIYEGLNIPAIKQVLKALASIHAFSLKNTDWQLNSDMNCSITIINRLSDGQYERMRRTMLLSLKNNYPDYFSGLIDKLLENFSLDVDFAYHLHEELGIPPVLTHGDLWMNNMLWQRSNGDSCEDETTDELVAIIDWQLVHPGCIGEDFVRLFCSSVSPEIRRRNLNEFLEYYHDCLRLALGQEPPFSVEQIKLAYCRLFRFGVMSIVPGFAAFVSDELSNLGSSNCAANRHVLLNRCRCLLEDFCASKEI